ncbi:MAG: PSD1 and planctomycete cytochrome C domain-containing protein [Gemmata sp.]
MRRLLPTLLAILLAPTASAGAEPAAAATFERDVLPILSSHCLPCHGGIHQRGGLDLRTAASALAGGESGKVIVPGDPKASELLKAVEAGAMPKGPIKVSAADKEVIRAWIAGGAKSAPFGGQLRVPPKARTAKELAEFIDREIDRRLADAKVPASPAADDGEFQRRVWLDVVGRIPTRAEAAAFLDGATPDKREKLIDALLARPEYGTYQARLWRDRVAVPIGAGEDLKGNFTAAFHTWLTDALNKNRRWDELVREMITAEGDAPPVAFVRQCMDDGQPRANKLAVSVSRRFLGVRLECAECHDHPFADWKQDDFWSLAAFFARTAKVEKNKTETRTGIYDSEKGPPRTRFGLKPLERKDGGAVLIPDDAGPRAKTVVPAKFPRGEVVKLDDRSPRAALAEWVTSPKNAMFARAAANRLWAQAFGRGLVNPVDSLEPENRPTHPELLDALAGEFVASGYDLKHLLRAVLLTRAYQRAHATVPGNERDELLYSHATGKVVNPESLFESLVVASGNTLDAKGNGSIGGKGKGVLASRGEFLKLFGTATADTDPGDYTQGIAQVLALLNDPAVSVPNRLVTDAAKEGGKTDAILTRVFVGVLSRNPRDEELKLTREYVSRRKSPLDGYQAVWWALVNSPEFAVIP